MQGSSRAAAAVGQQALDAALTGAADPGRLGEDLFGMGATLDSSAALRRALTDPTRDADAKGDLAKRLFLGKVSNEALAVLMTLVGERWSTERDLTDTVERLAVQSVLASAEAARTADAVEDELFRFERVVAGTPALRDALLDRQADPAAKAALVDRLLSAKARPQTVRLARQAVLAPRGRRFAAVIEDYLEVIAERRKQLTATVTSAIELTAAQRVRLAGSLTAMYDRPVHLQTVVDPNVLGGIRVEIGDEVVDGTVLRKLDGARRHFGG